jgi:ubiquinone/menaquinone biosynthesis C-methylase UbiE
MSSKSRGETSFVGLPGFGAWIYDRLMRGANLDRHYADIAADVVSRCKHGRLLDVGAGPGRLLIEVARIAPELELHGLDIAAAMVERARANLGRTKVELRVGSIQRTDYPADFFDAVVCSGSFYLWDRPTRSLDEIFHILKPGGSAYLYESYSDFDKDEFRAALAATQSAQSWMGRRIGGHFLRRQLRMTYSTGEVQEIVRGTRFAATSSVEKIILADLPAWMRITLQKPAA